jgi:hypothetical protein
MGGFGDDGVGAETLEPSATDESIF